MEQVGINNVQQVQYQPKTAATEPSFTGKKPEMKEDGDKKLLGALAGLGAIGLGGVLIARDLKNGNASHLKKAWGKITKKGAQKGAQKTAIKAGSKEAIAHSKNIVKGASTEAQEKINKLTNGVQDAVNNKKAYEALESKIALSEKAIAVAEKAGKDMVTIDGKTMKLDKAKGHLSNFIGELKKMKKPSDTDVQKAVDAVRKEASTPEGAGIINMQRAARKHPEVSQESLAKIANATPTKTTTAAIDVAESYDKYVKGLQKKNKTPMSFIEYQQKIEASNNYRTYLDKIKKENGTPVTFAEFIKQNK